MAVTVRHSLFDIIFIYDSSIQAKNGNLSLMDFSY